MLCYYGDYIEEYRKREDNIKMDLKEGDVDVMNWIELVQSRDHWRVFANEALNLSVA